MSLTPSNMLPLGTVAPDFELPNVVTDQNVSLNALKSDTATVIIFMCNHCPYVLHILDKLIEVAKEYQAKDINFIAISSNDVISYPADAPEEMRKLAEQKNLPFPYLYDETQNVARDYQAACTPDFYVFDHALKCVYRGRFDDASPGTDASVTGKELTGALDCILTGNTIPAQVPSMGCNIKWK